MSETIPCRYCGRQVAAAIVPAPAIDRAAVMRATLKRIAEGQVMWGTYSHAETVLTYQRIARETLAQLGEPT